MKLIDAQGREVQPGQFITDSRGVTWRFLTVLDGKVQAHNKDFHQALEPAAFNCTLAEDATPATAH